MEEGKGGEVMVESAMVVEFGLIRKKGFLILFIYLLVSNIAIFETFN